MKLDSYKVADGQVTIVKIEGRFDAHNEAKVRDYLDNLLATGQHRVVVDLHQCNFMDSSALAALVQGLKHYRKRNGDLYLCSVQSPIDTIFSLTRLDRAFFIFSEQSDAVAAFSA